MILQFKDVVLGYENKIVAKDINFEIKKGDYLCMLVKTVQERVPL